jgi:uncharacterized delta-60 repeat protein
MVEALEDRCLLSAGAVDTAFGSGGVASTIVGAVVNGEYQASTDSVAVYSKADTTGNANKIVVGGDAAVSSTETDFALTRYNPNGTLDTTWGGTGIVMTSFGANSYITGLAIQVDGKIVAAGITTVGTTEVFALARYNVDGSLDTTFGTNGEVTTPFTTTVTTVDPRHKNRTITTVVALQSELDGVVLQPDGKIVAAGLTHGSSAGDITVARYNPNGTLDTTFGKNGLAITSSTAIPVPTGYVVESTAVRSLALGPGGTIVVAGYDYSTIPSPDPTAGSNSPNNPLVVRYTSTGTLDTTFGGTGIVSVGLAMLRDVATVQADGKVVIGSVISMADYTYDLTRLNANGTYDTSFGTNGFVHIPSASANSVLPDAIAVQPDGKIVIGGGEKTARFLTNGVPDAVFGTNGVSATAPWPFFESQAMALQPDGKIVLVGFSAPPSVAGTGFGVARFLGDSPTIGSFTASPGSATAGSTVTLTAANIVDLTAGATITQVAFYVDSNGDGLLEPGTDTLLGYATQSSPGVWTLTYTVNLPPVTYTLFAQAKDSDGVLGDPVALALTVK